MKKTPCPYIILFITLFFISFKAISQVCPFNPNSDTSFLVIDGSVNCSMKYRDKLYVGGDFNYIGKRNNGIAAVHASSGQTVSYNSLSYINGAFKLYTSDQEGVAYGYTGQFIQEEEGRLIAYIGSNGNVSSFPHSFIEDNIPDDFFYSYLNISSMASTTNLLAVTGQFSKVDGEIRNNFAVFDLHSGTLKQTNIEVEANTIYKMRFVGNKLYVAGNFDSIGGQPRYGIAAIDTTTWSVTSWNAGLSAGDNISSITGNNTTVVIAGWFSSIMNQPRNGIAAFDANSGALKSFNPSINNTVYAMDMKGDTLYVAGSIYDINGTQRIGLASLDIQTGTLTSWNPVINQSPFIWQKEIYSILIQGNTLYAGGNFTELNGMSRLRLAAFDIYSGDLTAWNPKSANIPSQIIANGDNLLLGDVKSTGGEMRNYLAAFDTLTEKLTSWNPNSNQLVYGGGVYALGHLSDTIYIGGAFDSIGGYKRRSIAAIDAGTGSVFGWNPSLDNGPVSTIHAENNIVYAGGGFSKAGNQTRNNFAAINASTGISTALDLNTDGQISTLLLDSNILYIGGEFSSILGSNRNNLASVNLSTNLLTSWNPQPHGEVKTLLKKYNKIWAGGSFDTVGTAARSLLAVFDAPTGTLLPMNLNSFGRTGMINCLYIQNGLVVIGGDLREYISPNSYYPATVYEMDTLLNDLQLLFNVGNEMRTITEMNDQIFLGGRPSYYNYGNSQFWSKFTPQIYVQPKSTSICKGGNGKLALSGWGGVGPSYLWQKNNVDVPNSNSDVLTFNNVSYADTGWYRCITFFPCGSLLSDSAFLSVVDGTAPTLNFTVNDSVQCLKNNSFSFSAQATVPTGVINYKWDFGNGHTSSQADTSIYYSYASHYPITLTASQNGGPCKASITKYVDVLASPQANITTTDPVLFCGNGIVNINANTGNNLMYQWLKNQLAINLADDSTYTANTSGVYNVVVTGDNSCADTSNSIIVQMNTLPSVTLNTGVDSIELNASSITLTGGLPMGGIYSGNGVSNGMFSPAIAGLGIHKITYIYTDANTCSDSSSSDINVYLNTGLANLVDTKQILLYPNPASEKLIISIPLLSANAKMNITDMYGKSILQTKVNSSNLTIDLSAFIPATYCVVITDQGHVYTSHFVKINN